MHGLEAQYAGQVRFVYLDIDDPRTAPFKKALNYRYQPHIFLLDPQGQVLAQWVGPITGEEIAAAIEQAMGR